MKLTLMSQGNCYKAESIDEIFEYANAYNEYFKNPHTNELGTQYTFYRGQSISYWEIEPSIMRTTKAEGEIIHEWVNLHPYISKNMTLFETIAKIQHNEPHTRFIDFSLDINVALYFACNKESQCDGSLFMCTYTPHNPEWANVLILVELAALDFNETIPISDFSNIILSRHPELHKRFQAENDLNMFIMSFLDHGLMVMPNESDYRKNLKLQRQNGCFFICGAPFEKEITSRDRFLTYSGGNRFYSRSASVPQFLKNDWSLLKLIIPYQFKKEILDYLNQKGINEQYLFPKEDN